jgi:D-alanyl-D-alanine carboxypeptidase
MPIPINSQNIVASILFYELQKGNTSFVSMLNWMNSKANMNNRHFVDVF